MPGPTVDRTGWARAATGAVTAPTAGAIAVARGWTPAATGAVRAATGAVMAATGAVMAATGAVSAATGAVTGALMAATGAVMAGSEGFAGGAEGVAAGGVSGTGTRLESGPASGPPGVLASARPCVNNTTPTATTRPTSISRSLRRNGAFSCSVGTDVDTTLFPSGEVLSGLVRNPAKRAHTERCATIFDLTRTSDRLSDRTPRKSPCKRNHGNFRVNFS